MAEFEINRILAQNRPAGTGTNTAYTKPTSTIVTITAIVVCNTTGSSANYSIYACKNGTTYDQTTALCYSAILAANTTVLIEIPFTLDTTSGTVGIQSGTGNALNFTILGKIKESI